MAYYLPYQNQYVSQLGQMYNQQIPVQSPQQQNNQSSLIWVQGVEAAKSYLVAPNTTVLLMDSEQQRFYLKSSDASGMPLPLRIFEYKELAQNGANNAPKNQMVDYSTFATKAEFDAFKAEINSILNDKTKQTVAEV